MTVMEKSQIVVPKVWRSEYHLIVIFLLLGIASLFLTRYFPGSIVAGRVINFAGWRIDLALPLFWFLPLLSLVMGVWRIYDVRYVVDSRGLESRVGILGLNQRITRVRYNDIRSAETEQTIVGRFLNVGDVEVGTAATSQIEIIFRGVSAPQELQNMIQRERDRWLQNGQAAVS